MSGSASAKRKKHSSEVGVKAGAEDSELFRCITESHPLPVWVDDEETCVIVYESLSASEMLGRKWDPDKAQFISDHYVDIAERENCFTQALVIADFAGALDVLNRVPQDKRATHTDGQDQTNRQRNAQPGRKRIEQKIQSQDRPRPEESNTRETEAFSLGASASCGLVV